MEIAFDTSAADHRSVPAPPVPLSVILSLLFVGTHFVIYVSTIISTTSWRSTVYSTDDYGVLSSVTLALLFVYLGVDFWQWRQRGESHRRLYVVVFGVTALLLAGIGYFLARVSGF